MTGHISSVIWCDRRGATAIEYGFLAGGLALSIAAAVVMLGGNVDGLFGEVGGVLSGGGDTRGDGTMQVVVRQTFETDREGWSGVAPPRTLDLIGTGLSLAGESRIGNAREAVSRSFDIPDGATRAEISFDMSFVDSWDANEQAKVYVNGTEVMVGEHLWNQDTAPSLVQSPVDGMTIDAQMVSGVQAGSWSNGTRGTDYTYEVTITVDEPGETLQLGFGTSLNQDQSDESLLIGNVELRAGS